MDVRRRLVMGKDVDRLVGIMKIFTLELLQDADIGMPIARTSRTTFSPTRTAQLCLPLPPTSSDSQYPRTCARRS